VVITTTSNFAGQALSVSVGEGSSAHTSQYLYNQDGQLTQVVDALGHTIQSNTYDSRGRLYTTKDARGTVTQFTYDEVNRIITRQVDPPVDHSVNPPVAHPADPPALNLTTQYEFDAFGQQITVTEAPGTAAERVTRYEYDQKGELFKVTVDPQGLKLLTTYAYDGLGNTLQISQGTVDAPNQRVTQYVFDALGRRIQQIEAPSAVLGAGEASERDLTTQYRYDAAGRLSRTIDANGNSTWFLHDRVGELIGQVDALGQLTRNVYDQNGRLAVTHRYTSNTVDVSGLGDVAPDIGTLGISGDAPNASTYSPTTMMVA